MIKPVNGKFELRSKDGNKLLGTFDTKAEAEERERKIRGFSERSMVNVSLSITKASVLKDGTMRFQATCSDTDPDSRGEQTTLSLFDDWTDRIEKSTSVDWLPAPVLPFLGIAHYPAFHGKGEAAVIEKAFTDGKQFKVSGQFHSNDVDFPCGIAAFNAVQAERDLIQKGETIDNPLEISAAWFDLQHSHNDFIFTRKSLDDKCPMCAEGQPRKFLKGHLDHMAITRHPVHPRTSIGLEEMSENTITRQQDAASIVGDELAEMLDKLVKPTEKSESVSVVLSDHLDEENGTSHLGPMSFEELEKLEEVAETRHQVQSNFDKFMFISKKILNVTDSEFDLKAAMKKVLSDFEARIGVLKSETIDSLMLSKTQIGGVQMSDEVEVQVTGHPVDAFKQIYDTALANTSLDRTGKLEALQGGINALAEGVKAKMDVVAPQSVADQLSLAMSPILQELKLLNAKSGQQVQSSGQPTQRSLSPGQQIVNPGQPVQPVQKSERTPMTQFLEIAAQTTLAV